MVVGLDTGEYAGANLGPFGDFGERKAGSFARLAKGFAECAWFGGGTGLRIGSVARTPITSGGGLRIVLRHAVRVVH